MPAHDHNVFWFALGRETTLSIAEIIAVTGIQTYKRLGTQLASFELADAAPLMKRLGGTIKIARQIVTSLSHEALIEACQTELLQSDGKIIFGLSFYPGAAGVPGWTTDTLTDFGKQLKSRLKEEGRSVRYVPNRETILSSATVFHNDLHSRGRELLIIPDDAHHFSLAVTVAVQPFEDFSVRDYERPAADSQSGMLPPKLALMLINLANGEKTGTLLDPFCGSGTVLMEAMMQGYRSLIGSDLSPKAVHDSQQNSAWARERFHVTDTSVTIFEHDARQLGEKLSPQSVTTIVTEPYLGPPLRGNEPPETIKKNSAELTALYIAAFQSFAKLLKRGSVVVFVIPRFVSRTETIILSEAVLPAVKRLGFSVVPLLPQSSEPFLLYQRPGQRAAREIWKFTLA